MRCALITLFLATLFAFPARAQELEPRAYANAPIGLNFLIAGYAHSEGGVAFDPSIPLDNADLEVQSALLAYAHSFAAWGRSAKFDVVWPYAWLDGSADFDGQPIRREVSGSADPTFRVSFNLYGAPAMSLSEIRNYKQDLIVGVSFSVSAPIGQYDPSRFVNIGTNRWAFKPEIGLSKAVGPWTFELISAAILFADNDEYPVDRTREQDPVYSVQGGAIRGFSTGAWLALFGTYYTGGRTTIDGVRGQNLQENTRLGLILALPVNRNNSIKLAASTGVSTRTGTDFDAFAVAWQYRWGGGL